MLSRVAHTQSGMHCDPIGIDGLSFGRLRVLYCVSCVDKLSVCVVDALWLCAQSLIVILICINCTDVSHAHTHTNECCQVEHA